jgi:RNA polymerase sigma-70 factor (ECF subfamily)
MPNDEFSLQHDLASAFLRAVRAGDVDALLAVLDPEVVIRGGAKDPVTGEPRVAHGAATVAAGAVRFSAHAADTYRTFVDGAVTLTWMPNGVPRSMLTFRAAGGRMVEINIVDDPERLRQLDMVVIGH